MEHEDDRENIKMGDNCDWARLKTMQTFKNFSNIFYDSYTYFINKLLFPVFLSIQQLCLVLVNFIFVFDNSI